MKKLLAILALKTALACLCGCRTVKSGCAPLAEADADTAYGAAAEYAAYEAAK